MSQVVFYPAIDLKDGQCVRLVHGDMGQATVFNDDPAAQAEAFAAAGCTWLHMVDLDGAFAGRPANAYAVSAVLDRVNQRLSNLEKVRRFMVLAEPFTVDNEMLTPTLKIRRHKIRAAYGAELEGLYAKK